VLGYLLGPPALLLTPLVVFLRHHGYPLFAPEALICIVVLSSIGLILGLPGAIGGRYPAILILAGSITLVVDIQLQLFDGWNQAVIGIFAISALSLFALGSRLSRITVVMAWALLLTSFWLPAEPQLQSWQSEPRESPLPESPPLVLHIILDEQIGIEGVPGGFDPEGRTAEQLRSFYLDRGFRVFGRAYSRYYDSEESLSNLLNFSSSLEPSVFYRGEFSSGKSMQRNAYFDEMIQRGYRVKVYQSDYMDFCSIDRAGGEVVATVASCHEYALETIASIEKAPLAVVQKTRLILAMFSRLSFLITEAQRGYNSFRLTVANLGLTLPEWVPDVGRVSSVSAMSVFDRLQRDLADAEPGSLFFAHLLLPHFPYAYDDRCELRPNMRGWLNGWARTPNGRRNNTKSRRRRYPLYLEQVACTHQKLAEVFDAMQRHGQFDDAIVIVQGDHGSRIDMGPPRHGIARSLRRRDYIDAFSTLYAIKFPGEEPLYDRRILPIDELLARHIQDGELPPGIEWAPRPVVHLSRSGTSAARRARASGALPRMVEHPLPPFSHGKISE
jgi:hypothetical protein